MRCQLQTRCGFPLFKRQDKERKRQKLQHTQKGHSAVRSPQASAQQEQHETAAGRKKRAFRDKDFSFFQFRRKQNCQEQHGKRRAPGEEQPDQERRSEQKAFQRVRFMLSEGFLHPTFLLRPHDGVPRFPSGSSAFFFRRRCRNRRTGS